MASGLFRPAPGGGVLVPFDPHWSLLRTEVVPFHGVNISVRNRTEDTLDSILNRQEYVLPLALRPKVLGVGGRETGRAPA